MSSRDRRLAGRSRTRRREEGEGADRAQLAAARWHVWGPIGLRAAAVGVALLGLAGIGAVVGRAPLAEAETRPSSHAPNQAHLGATALSRRLLDFITGAGTHASRSAPALDFSALPAPPGAPRLPAGELLEPGAPGGAPNPAAAPPIAGGVAPPSAPRLDTPTFDAPTFDTPTFDTPTFDTPPLDAPQIDTPQVAAAARSAAALGAAPCVPATNHAVAPHPAPAADANPPAPRAPSRSARLPPAAIQPVVLNRADAVELRRLPGIGAKRAEAILELRQRLGRFRRPSDLLRIKGIGPRTLERMLPHLRMDEDSAPSTVPP